MGFIIDNRFLVDVTNVLLFMSVLDHVTTRFRLCDCTCNGVSIWNESLTWREISHLRFIHTYRLYAIYAIVPCFTMTAEYNKLQQIKKYKLWSIDRVTDGRSFYIKKRLDARMIRLIQKTLRRVTACLYSVHAFLVHSCVWYAVISS